MVKKNLRAVGAAAARASQATRRLRLEGAIVRDFRD
jgi:hypothetical protein